MSFGKKNVKHDPNTSIAELIFVAACLALIGILVAATIIPFVAFIWQGIRFFT